MNWGQGIAAFLTVFVIFIGVLVYMTTQSTFDLEAEDYYKQEIEYQDRIDAISKGKDIDPYLRMEKEGEVIAISLDGIELAIPDKGKVEFFRANDSSLDRSYDMDLSSGNYEIPLSDFVKGFYTVRFFWDDTDGGYEVKRELTVD